MANEVIKFFGKLLLLGVKTCPNSAFLAAPGDFCATFLSFLSKVADISTAHIMVLKANTSFSSFVMVLRVHHISFRNGSRVHCINCQMIINLNFRFMDKNVNWTCCIAHSTNRVNFRWSFIPISLFNNIQHLLHLNRHFLASSSRLFTTLVESEMLGKPPFARPLNHWERWRLGTAPHF